MYHRDTGTCSTKVGDVMVVVVVGENEEHNETPPIMIPIFEEFKDVVPKEYHMGCHP